MNKKIAKSILNIDSIPWKSAVAVVLSILYFNGEVAEAQAYNSATSKGTGGSGRAAVDPGDVLFLNPAMQVHLQGRHLYISTTQTKDQTEMVFQLSDNTRESLVPGSLMYLQREITVGSEKIKESDLGISLAEFGGDRWAMGLTFHMIESKLTNSSFRQNTADLGFSYNLSPNLGLGAVLYNIYEADEVPDYLKRQGQFGVGLTYIFGKIARYRLDFVSGNKYQADEGLVLAGIESFLNNWIIFRMGLGASLKENNGLWSLGAGFKGPVFQFNYAYQDPHNDEKEGIHSIDLVIPF